MTHPKTDPQPNPAPARTVTVTLKQPHRHAGRDHKAGDKLTVTERQRDWLAQRGKV